MVTPVTGPFVTTTQFGPTGAETYYDRKIGYKQTLPVDRNLDYWRDIRYATPGGLGLQLGAVQAFSNTFWTPSLWDDLGNKAYDRLKDKIGSNASLGVSLAEYNQAISMMTRRLLSLGTAARQIRRFEFQSAARTLLSGGAPQGVSRHKTFASNWLEFHFGWSPLVKDVYDTIDVLQSPVKPQFITATASLRGLTSLDQSASWGNDALPGYRYWYQGDMRLKMGVRVSVSNPNLALASQLGLVNPAVLLWELVPFSFVVDWFVNVEQFLSSGTDFLGLTLGSGFTTKSNRQRCVLRGYSPFWSAPSFKETTGNAMRMERNMGIQTPVLKIRPLKAWGWKRGLTAASLLTLQLRR